MESRSPRRCLPRMVVTDTDLRAGFGCWSADADEDAAGAAGGPAPYRDSGPSPSLFLSPPFAASVAKSCARAGAAVEVWRPWRASFAAAPDNAEEGANGRWASKKDGE